MAADWLVQLAARTQGWADYYGSSGTVSLAVTYAHVAAMLIGGGLALSQDRAIWRLPATDEALPAALAGQQDVHRPVVIALVISFVTGALMFAADVEALGGNWVYWVKMALVALLLGNGVLMLRAERAAAIRAPRLTLDALRRHAAVSGALWLLIALAGTGLLQG
jgi:hypothetical protein